MYFSFGVLPDKMGAKASTSEKISSRYGKLQFSKDKQEGMILKVGDRVISVNAKNEYYTNQK